MLNKHQVTTLNAATVAAMERRYGITTEQRREVRLRTLTFYLGRQDWLSTSGAITTDEYNQLIQAAYPDWHEGNWDQVDSNFGVAVQEAQHLAELSLNFKFDAGGYPIEEVQTES